MWLLVSLSNLVRGTSIHHSSGSKPIKRYTFIYLTFPEKKKDLKFQLSARKRVFFVYWQDFRNRHSKRYDFLGSIWDTQLSFLGPIALTNFVKSTNFCSFEQVKYFCLNTFSVFFFELKLLDSAHLSHIHNENVQKRVKIKFWFDTDEKLFGSSVIYSMEIEYKRCAVDVDGVVRTVFMATCHRHFFEEAKTISNNKNNEWSMFFYFFLFNFESNATFSLLLLFFLV